MHVGQANVTNMQTPKFATVHVYSLQICIVIWSHNYSDYDCGKME